MHTRGTFQMAAFTLLAYYLASTLESYAAGLTLPDQYTARNLTTALRTVVVAAAYLATFLLGANTVGLAGEFFPSVCCAHRTPPPRVDV